MLKRFEAQIVKSDLYARLDRLFLGQQIVAVLFLPAAIVACETLAHRGRARRELVCSILVVVSCGYWISWPLRAAKAARYTWFIPTVAFALIFLDERRRFGVGPAASAFFSIAPMDDETLATILFTVPTCSAILYSIGAALRAVR